MIATDVYKPDEWHEFFLATAGAAAALAGLVFVALSIHADVLRNVTRRNRATNMLTGFTAAFIISTLALMGGQDHQAVGTEWFVVATGTLVIYVYHYVQAARRGSSKAQRRPDRLVVGVTSYFAQIVGAFVLILGYVAGLYLAAIGLIVTFAVLISGSWLLLVNVEVEEDR
jgi:modulator of FtsH protease